ncbi:hypothetical protein Xcc2124 [Bordetella pertussis]|nr:hypothetical protein Xcc2124 [Bordetella pertussis]
MHTGRPMPVPARETDAVRDHANCRCAIPAIRTCSPSAPTRA